VSDVLGVGRPFNDELSSFVGYEWCSTRYDARKHMLPIVGAERVGDEPPFVKVRVKELDCATDARCCDTFLVQASCEL
jgi:hypothetical protein